MLYSISPGRLFSTISGVGRPFSLPPLQGALRCPTNLSQYLGKAHTIADISYVVRPLHNPYPVRHWLTMDTVDAIVRFDDGSSWLVNWSQHEIMRGWRIGDSVTITQGESVMSRLLAPRGFEFWEIANRTRRQAVMLQPDLVLPATEWRPLTSADVTFADYLRRNH